MPIATTAEEGNDDCTQAGNLFRLMPADERERLFRNIAEAMAGVPTEIVRRQLANFVKADPAYGQGVAKALDVETLVEAAE